MVASFLTKCVFKENRMYCIQIFKCITLGGFRYEILHPSSINMKREVINRIHDNKSYPFVY